jgi:hypothetical protein
VVATIGILFNATFAEPRFHRGWHQGASEKNHYRYLSEWAPADQACSHGREPKANAERSTSGQPQGPVPIKANSGTTS